MHEDWRQVMLFLAGILTVVGTALLAAGVVHSLGGGVLLTTTAAFLTAALALGIAATPSEAE